MLTDLAERQWTLKCFVLVAAPLATNHVVRTPPPLFAPRSFPRQLVDRPNCAGGLLAHNRWPLFRDRNFSTPASAAGHSAQSQATVAVHRPPLRRFHTCMVDEVAQLLHSHRIIRTWSLVYSSTPRMQEWAAGGVAIAANRGGVLEPSVMSFISCPTSRRQNSRWSSAAATPRSRSRLRRSAHRPP